MLKNFSTLSISTSRKSNRIVFCGPREPFPLPLFDGSLPLPGTCATRVPARRVAFRLGAAVDVAFTGAALLDGTAAGVLGGALDGWLLAGFVVGAAAGGFWPPVCAGASSSVAASPARPTPE